VNKKINKNPSTQHMGVLNSLGNLSRMWGSRAFWAGKGSVYSAKGGIC